MNEQEYKGFLQLIIGNEDCGFNEVVDALLSIPSVSELANKKKDLASKLGLSTLQLYELKKLKDEPGEFFSEMLIKYRSKKGSDATLENLIKALTNLQLKDPAESLVEKFDNKLNKSSNPEASIEQCPRMSIQKVDQGTQTDEVNITTQPSHCTDECNRRRDSADIRINVDMLANLVLIFYKLEKERRLNERQNLHNQTALDVDEEVGKTVTNLVLLISVIANLERSKLEEMIRCHLQERHFKTTIGILDIAYNMTWSEPILGIDLGNSKCCVGIYWQGKVTILKNELEHTTFPSCVSFEEGGTVLVVHNVKTNLLLSAQNTVYNSKRIIGRLYGDEYLGMAYQYWPFALCYPKNIPTFLVGANLHNPEEISAHLLRECHRIGEKHLKRPISKAVITVPTCFYNHQREATYSAAKMAGLDTLAIINDAVASCTTYKYHRMYDDSRKVLIFDLGSSKLDIAVMQVDEGVRPLALVGDTTVGGEDFEMLLMRYCIEEFKSLTGIDILDESKNENVPRSKARLKSECEERKIDLVKVSATYVTVDDIVMGKDLKIKVTRDKFEHLCTGYLQKMKQLVVKVLQDANIQKFEIKDAILVGGSARIPILQKMLKEMFEDESLNFIMSQDEEVAFGAAIYGANLTDNNAKHIFNIRYIEDVIPMAIEIEAIINGEKGKFATLIPKYSTYPLKVTESFPMDFKEYKEVVFHVYQYNEKDRYFVGEFLVDGMPYAFCGKQEIFVSIEINAHGLVHMTAESVVGTERTEINVRLRRKILFNNGSFVLNNVQNYNYR